MNVYLICKDDDGNVFCAIETFIVHGGENADNAMKLLKFYKYEDIKAIYCQGCGNPRKPGTTCGCGCET